MRTIYAGGPAFPVPGLHNDSDFNGMSLRDYFAAHAPNPPDGWVKFEGKAGDLANAAEAHAIWRRLYADAMLSTLKARHD